MAVDSYHHRTLLNIIVAALFLFACSFNSSNKSSQLTLPKQLAVRPKTELPADFNRALPPSENELPILNIPATMLLAAKVIRPHAEVRVGPHVDYKIADQLLTRGTRVIVYERIGVWQKILVPANGQRGWVHHETLSPAKPSKIPIEVPAKWLPTVFAHFPIIEAYDYNSAQPVKVDIPKGTIFVCFIKARRRTLVWIAETNSVLWLPSRQID